MTKPVNTSDEIARLAQLANSVDCLSEEDLILLAGITRSTAEAWRRRGDGPYYVLIGNRYLYPRKAVAEYLDNRIRIRAAPLPMRGSL